MPRGSLQQIGTKKRGNRHGKRHPTGKFAKSAFGVVEGIKREVPLRSAPAEFGRGAAKGAAASAVVGGGSLLALHGYAAHKRRKKGSR